MPADPAVSLGGGEAGPASGKRLSDREPGLGGTPESKGSRMTRSEVYADIESQVRHWHWQTPQRVEPPAVAPFSDPEYRQSSASEYYLKAD